MSDVAKKYVPAKGGFKKAAPPTATSKISKTAPRPSSNEGEDNRGLFMLVYGPPGVGKSSFAAEFPGVRFIIDKQEQGIRNLVRFRRCKTPEHGIVTVDTMDELVSATVNMPDEVETAVFDSLSVFQYLAFASQLDSSPEYKGDWAKFHEYAKGPGAAADSVWRPWMGACNELLLRGKNVILLAHATIKGSDNVQGADYKKVLPNLDARIWAKTNITVQTVVAMAMDVTVTKQGKDNKVDDQSSGARVMYTELNPFYEAKNCFGLPPVIQMGDTNKSAYDNFMSEYNACLSGAQEE